MSSHLAHFRRKREEALIYDLHDLWLPSYRNIQERLTVLPNSNSTSNEGGQILLQDLLQIFFTYISNLCHDFKIDKFRISS